MVELHGQICRLKQNGVGTEEWRRIVEARDTENV